MSSITHKCIRGVGLSAAGLLAALHVVPPAFADPTVLSASVTVLPEGGCTLLVTPPTDPTFTLNWGADSGIERVNPTSAPRNLTVQAADDAGCTLNALKITSEVGGQHPPGTNGKYSFRVPLMPGGEGYWRFMPYLARAQFYLDRNATQEGTGKITYHSPSPYDLTFQTTPKFNAGDKEYLAVMGESPGEAANSLFMTDEYVTDGGALLVDGDNVTGTFTSDNSSEVYKSAVLGMGVVVATGPENSQGTRDDSVARPGDSATMTWTVTVSAQ